MSDIDPTFVSDVESSDAPPQIVSLDNPHKLALVIDGVVQDMLTCDMRLAAILLSSPTILDVSEIRNDANILGWEYDSETNKLSPPSK